MLNQDNVFYETCCLCIGIEYFDIGPRIGFVDPSSTIKPLPSEFYGALGLIRCIDGGTLNYVLLSDIRTLLKTLLP